MSEDNTADCAVGVLLDLQTPEKKPPRIIPSTYTKPEKPVEDGHDHESSFTISAPGDIDLPVNVSNIKRVLNENINDSIEVRREEIIGAERCITPGEVPVHEGVIKLLDDEQFDFDIPFSPALKKKTSREPSPSENAPGDDDDEIFFGPMGHTEKCVSKAVEDVIQEEEMIKPLSPLNPKQMAELFKEAHRVVYHIEATAPKGSESSVESENSVPARTLNFSNLSVNDSVSSVCTTDISAHFSPPRSPRQRKNTFTKEESALDNLSEALNKALPNVEPLQRDKNGALKFSACGQRKAGEAKSGGFARGSAIRRSLPISMGRGLKPVGIKKDTGRKPQGQQTYLKRSSVGKCEKRQRHDSGASTDDAMSIASNDSEASWCTLPSGKRGLPQPKLKPSSSGLKPPGQSRLARPARPHSRSNTIHTPGSTSRPKAESRIDCKPTPTRRSLGSQPMGSKLSLPRSKLPGDSGLQKPLSSLSKPANKPAASTTSSRISTTRLSNSKSQSSLGSVKGQQSSTGSKLAAQKSGIPGKSPVNMTVTKPSGLTKPAIKGTMTKLDNLKPGTMQRKQVVGSKLGAPGAGPLKATGLSRPGGNKTTPRLTPKEPVANKSKMAKENTPERPIPKPSSGTVTKSTSGTGTHKVPILTTPVKAEKNVQPKRLTLQDTTNRTPRKSDSSLSSIGTPVSAVKRRSFLPTPNKTLSISSVDSDLGKGVGSRTGSASSQGSDPSPAVGMLVDIGFGTIPDTPTAFMAKPKVLSTPQTNKEKQPKSIWSPVRKPRMALEDEVIQCTKRFSVYQKK